MGTMNEQMVICTTYDFECNDRRKLDSLVEHHPHLFAKSGSLINSTISYIMFWDGSKEGWDESIHGDDLRACFLSLCKELYLAKIYEINNHEHFDNHPELILTKVNNIHLLKPSEDETT